MWERHVKIGLDALRLGFLEIAVVAATLRELAAAPDVDVERAWVGPGRLDPGQLAALTGLAANQFDRASTLDDRSTDLDAGSDPGSDAGSVARAHTRPVDDHVQAIAAASTEGPRYVPVRVLATGGMGHVHECVDRVLGRRVALKSLLRESIDRDTAIAMLEREARVTAKLQHPNIISVHDAGRHDELGSFYVMRLIEEPTLGDVLKRLRRKDPDAVATYSLGRLMRYFVQVCQAVDYAHAQGVLHCDLKPANVILGRFGEVMVIDWGLAAVLDDSRRYRGGTYGYMAPEQLDVLGQRPLDIRTDVFALGAILYELLALAPPFADPPHGATLPPLARPVPPDRVAPDRAIPAELVELCMRALALDPGERAPTARALADGVDAFLEGTRERERLRAAAAELCREGDRLTASYRDLVDTRPDRMREIAELRTTVPGWASPEHKGPLWRAEDRVKIMDGLCIRTLQAAVAAYDRALEEVPGFPCARRGLATLYGVELRRAMERRDDLERIYFEELVGLHDDGAVVAELGRSASLSITATAPVAVNLAHLEERGRRLVEVRRVALGSTPIATEVPTGTHVVILDTGLATVRWPVRVTAGARIELALDVANAATLDPDEVLVPAGPALLSEPEAERTELEGMHTAHVPAFIVATLPVRFADYLAFLTEVTVPHVRELCLPMTTDGRPLWQWEGGAFQPAEIQRWATDPAAALELPAVGIGVIGAGSYLNWLSKRRGRRYRLLREDEWEKAARGVDGRRYPWGDQFDPSFCKMRESRPSRSGLEPPGTFVADVSPYGVRDLAGGVAEWVESVSGHRSTDGVLHVRSRGGAWCDSGVECDLAARRHYLANERSVRVGFRAARTP